MAFCTSCGNTLDETATSCPKCGAAVAGPVVRPMPPAAPYTTPTGAAPPPSAAQGGNQALRIVIIIVAVVIGLGIIGTAIAAYVGIRVARKIRVEEHDGKTTVNTPFGEVTTDEHAVAENLDVDIYPGARQQEGSKTVTVGGMSTAQAEFESDDPPEKVAQFYREHYPEANITASDGKDHTIIVSRDQHMITIHVEPRGNGSAIHIANIAGAPGMRMPKPPRPPRPPRAGEGERESQ